MPNALATLALAVWPLVTVIFFRKLPAGRAVIATLLIGYLFLPEAPAGFDFPLIPTLDKHTIPAISAMLMWVFMYGAEGGFLPRSRLVITLLVVFVVSPLFTSLLNADLVTWGRFVLPSMSLKDAISFSIIQVLLLLPFLLARRFLNTAEDQRDLLLAFMIGGLVYSIPMLIEIRLSPQLNFWIYGFYQHDFLQTIRFGGFRPMVFLYHGLWAAFFLLMAVLSALALYRAEKSLSKYKILFMALYLLGVLVLSKSLGAWLFAAVFAPAILFLKPRAQMRLALCLALLAVTYPALKGIGAVPQEFIIGQAEKISPARAESLWFRFSNEDQLLERASERPLFGWGSYDRNQIIDPSDGVVQTITDGRWIILIGQFGWVGFLAEFGLLILPIVFLWRESQKTNSEHLSPFIVPLSLILAINVFDMLPNATLTTLTWIMAGALTGYSESLRELRENRSGEKKLEWRPVL